MSPNAVLEQEDLTNFTEEQRKTRAICWYRTPLDRADMKSLHQRSDIRGFLQTGGYLGIFAATASAAIYSAWHCPWWVTVLAVFVHGTVGSFLLNGVHELGHGTVFKTKVLNVFFVRVLAFLGWTNYEMFGSSHVRHHRYTLHPPDDQEVKLPIRLVVRDFLKSGFFSPMDFFNVVKFVTRMARGKFIGEWELTLYPESDPEERRRPVRWARVLLFGHGAIFLISAWFGWWIIPVVVSLSPFFGGWLVFLCNNTQHIGLRDNVPDFRLCCRTFTLNPVVRFLYWQMNYHIEHHMYAAVPCYNLARLHELIKYDLPPCQNGLIAVWREIASIQHRQDSDHRYQHQAILPGSVDPR